MYLELDFDFNFITKIFLLLELLYFERFKLFILNFRFNILREQFKKCRHYYKIFHYLNRNLFLFFLGFLIRIYHSDQDLEYNPFIY